MIVPCGCTHPVHLADPRKADTCGRCGRTLRPGDVVPIGLGVNHDRTRARDHRWERDFAHEAGHRASLPAVAVELREFADRRMLPGPWRNLDRDWMQESAEELADCIQYVGEQARMLGAREDAAAEEARFLLVELGADLVRAYWRARRVQELLR